MSQLRQSPRPLQNAKLLLKILLARRPHHKKVLWQAQAGCCRLKRRGRCPDWKCRSFVCATTCQRSRACQPGHRSLHSRESVGSRKGILTQRPTVTASSCQYLQALRPSASVISHALACVLNWSERLNEEVNPQWREHRNGFQASAPDDLMLAQEHASMAQQVGQCQNLSSSVWSRAEICMIFDTVDRQA